MTVPTIPDGAWVNQSFRHMDDLEPTTDRLGNGWDKWSHWFARQAKLRCFSNCEHVKTDERSWAIKYHPLLKSQRTRLFRERPDLVLRSSKRRSAIA